MNSGVFDVFHLYKCDLKSLKLSHVIPNVQYTWLIQRREYQVYLSIFCVFKAKTFQIADSYKIELIKNIAYKMPCTCRIQFLTSHCNKLNETLRN